MTEIQKMLQAWLADGCQIALVTVVQGVRSAPRLPGATMAVNDRGEVIGSVSGGCVEAAAYEEALAVIGDGRPRLLTFGIEDEDAFAVGLTCGGTIRLFVERLDWAGELWAPLAAALNGGMPAVTVCVMEGGRDVGRRLLVTAEGVRGRAECPALHAALLAEARAALQTGWTGSRRLCIEDGAEEAVVFIQAFTPPPRLFVFGAIDFAGALVRMGKYLGYRVILCDARSVFATRARFPEADEVVVNWPHEYLAGAGVGARDAICVLTHDAKFDVPALLAALATPAAYIGAMGSRSTHERRHRELREAGLSEADLGRIASPIGLDLGGRTPEETAVAIAAEMIALRNGRPAGRLGRSSGRIHHA